MPQPPKPGQGGPCGGVGQPPCPPEPAAAPKGSGLLQEPSESEGVSQDEVEIDQTLEDYLKEQGK